MSLMRYLSSGSRGLSEGAAPMGRYRLPDGQLIPNFSSAKNPFHAKDLPSQVPSSPAAGITAKAASTQAAPSSSVSLPRSARAAAGRVLAMARTGPRALLARVTRGGLTLITRVQRLYGGLLGRLSMRRTRPTLTLSSQAPVGGPVQGELSLENVRVVRNDLTDTDYEVVCSETATASPVKHVPQAQAKPSVTPAPPRSLGRLAERLFSQKTH